MEPKFKVVTRLPLTTLWREEGALHAVRLHDLKVEDIRNLLRLGTVQFVVANLGDSLRWIPVSECFHFWKSEVLPHVADPEGFFSLEDYPGEYCYVASEWECSETGRMVLIEKYH